ncbi:MAG: pilus assembly protein PilP [Desulfobacterales bacterium]|jgi:type IV pilus assembly protein PilP|nr:pilus assembly protein PilP [Desulfobacterales bacterium]
MMRKIICYILLGFILGSFLPGIGDHDSVAAQSVRYVSNRVKIFKPGVLASKEDTAKLEPGQAEIVEAAPGQTDTSGESPNLSELTTEEIGALSPEEQNELFLGAAGRFYTREGKVDPFEPFLRVPEAEVSNSEQEKLQIRPPQTPLEKFDLDQLKLTGILVSPAKIRALIEETSGKGYIISEGTYIGNKGGQVTKIANDRVVVEEKYLDVLGKVAVREIELKLRPDEE